MKEHVNSTRRDHAEVFWGFVTRYSDSEEKEERGKRDGKRKHFDDRGWERKKKKKKKFVFLFFFVFFLFFCFFVFVFVFIYSYERQTSSLSPTTTTTKKKTL